MTGSVLSDQISCQNTPEIQSSDIYIFRIFKKGKPRPPQKNWTFTDKTVIISISSTVVVVNQYNEDDFWFKCLVLPSFQQV